MENVHHLKDLDTIEDEAALWVVRLEDKECGPETVAGFQAWLKEDPRHKTVAEQYQTLWTRFDELGVIKQDMKVAIVRDGLNEAELRRRLPFPPLVARFGAIAATLVFAIAVTFFFTRTDVSVHNAETYATAVGQTRSVTLDDGSVLDLNTNTIIEVDYSEAERRIVLVKGEAHFEVAKNPDRPFIVDAGDTEVKAVGTAFNVHRTPDAPVEVIVTEGKVEVSRRLLPESGTLKGATAATPTEAPIFLEAGQSLGLTAEPQKVALVTERELDQKLAWRDGMLIFLGEPLEDVVDELSRYSDVRFVIMDDEIRHESVGGYFKMNDVDALIASLEEGLGVKVERRSDSVVLLSANHDADSRSE